ncbi:hypothetical protein JW879_04935 [candidate division WOR-3 bacterium]|nr:hypothetical protein [candidate division WOR-3 bacterium]
MFFSVFNYYTKPDKRATLNFSETKNFVKKETMEIFFSLSDSGMTKKIKTKNSSALFAPLR